MATWSIGKWSIIYINLEWVSRDFDFRDVNSLLSIYYINMIIHKVFSQSFFLIIYSQLKAQLSWAHVSSSKRNTVYLPTFIVITNVGNDVHVGSFNYVFGIIYMEFY